MQRAAIITQKRAVLVRLLLGGNLKSFDVLVPSELFLCHQRDHSLPKAFVMPIFSHVSLLMRVTSRFLQGLILLPSSRPALCVYRVMLQGLGLRSVEEGPLTGDGCDVELIRLVSKSEVMKNVLS